MDEASELYDVHNPFASLPTGVWLELEPLDLSGLEVESYLSHSARLEDGELATELLLRDAAGRERVIPLRAGLETAEWAYERDDVLTQIAHAMPQVASTWPASSGFPPRQHVGHTYLARFSFHEPFRLAAVMLRPRLPEAFVRVERVRLRLVSGQVKLLSHMVGLGDHSLAYRSEDVVIYRNNDVLPRAYLLPASAVEVGEGRLTTPGGLSAEEVIPVEVVRYEDLAVRLQASHEGPSYLILADLAYPGWHATVDGLEAPILVADGVFRALALPAGRHEVTFTYRPRFALVWLGF